MATLLLSPKGTLCCRFIASFILSPHFFEELSARGPVTCSITGQRYASLIKNKTMPDLQARHCLSHTIFMQDGVSIRNNSCFMDVSEKHFTEECVISRHFSDPWPPRSPDHSSCDFWLWVNLKLLERHDNLRTVPY